MQEYMKGQACSVKPISPLPENPVLAMAYVPYQKFENLYVPEKGLQAGTLFSDLDKPFLGGMQK